MKELAVSVAGVLLAVLAAAWGGEAAPQRPAPKTIPLQAGGKDYLPLLQGPPETVSMRAGLVALAPGKSVGKHSTKGNEEMLVVLEGQGEMRIAGRGSLPVREQTALYCPPNTEHDVINTGKATLRYVYVVAKATE